jgi:hypothetical protein
MTACYILTLCNQWHGGVPENYLNCCRSEELYPTSEKQTKKELNKQRGRKLENTERRGEIGRYKK